MAIGFGAAGVAAGTVAAAGVAGYAVGASQPFHEFAEEVVSDLGYGHPKETIQPEVLQEPLEKPDPETAIHVDDKVYEDSAVAAETGDELPMKKIQTILPNGVKHILAPQKVVKMR